MNNFGLTDDERLAEYNKNEAHEIIVRILKTEFHIDLRSGTKRTIALNNAISNFAVQYHQAQAIE
jgi:hypothetical protein